MAPRSVIIDCDPGHDDALAILLALGSPDEVDVLALTVVAGNVPLTLTEKNARKVCELAGRPDLPVYAGCARPLLRELITAEYVCGESGLDGPALPEPQMPLAEAHAVDAIVELLRAHPAGTITLCPTGPLTNVAMALRKAPDVASRIRQIVLMGGAIGEGNVTPAAEFNIHVDPHAAKVVFEAGAPLVMHGLDVTRQALVTPDRLEAIRSLGTPLGRTVAEVLEFYNIYHQTRRGRVGAPLHDPCVIAYLLEPGLFRGRTCHVAIETRGEHTLGRTVVDWSGRTSQRPNATVISEIDADGFFALLTERLARLPLAPATDRPAAPRR
jgi:purine nucleosidase